jgi:VanZ family protein
MSQTTPQLNPSSRSQTRRMARALALVYAGLIIYGSLYPFTGWIMPSQPIVSFLFTPVPAHNSGADLLTNLLAYAPLGMLLVGCFGRSASTLAILLATLLGGSLSFLLECTQSLLPSRTSSKVDLLMNLTGTIAGAVIGLAWYRDNPLRNNLRQVRAEWFEAGVAINIALCSALLWAASQLSPFVPSMDVSTIWSSLAPLRAGIREPAALSWMKIATYTFNLAGIGLLLGIVARPGRRMRLMFFALAALVLLAKPLIVTRQLGLEPLIGLGIAGMLLLLTPRKKAVETLVSMALILGGFIAAELSVSAGGGFHAFNWIPFDGQLDNTVSGFGSILDTVWPFVTLAGLTILGFGRRRGPMIYLGAALLGLTFAFERLQTGIEGRYGDITTVLVAALAWIVPWVYLFVSQPAPTPSRRSRGNRTMQYV